MRNDDTIELRVFPGGRFKPHGQEYDDRLSLVCMHVDDFSEMIRWVNCGYTYFNTRNVRATVSYNAYRMSRTNLVGILRRGCRIKDAARQLPVLEKRREKELGLT
jgi:hypothetical protein